MVNYGTCLNYGDESIHTCQKAFSQKGLHACASVHSCPFGLTH